MLYRNDSLKFIMINNELMNKYSYVFPEQTPLIILDDKSAVCMSNNGKDKKHTRHITRRILFLEMVKGAVYRKKFCVRQTHQVKILEPTMLGRMN